MKADRCVGCAMGTHPHDTYTANAPEVKRGEHQAGDDAGCPRAGCRCTYVVPPPRSKPDLIADALLGAEEILAVLYERGTRGVEEECSAGRIADVLRAIRTAKRHIA